VHECLFPTALHEFGIGNIIVSKALPSGLIGMGVFLLDVYCPGVKDAFYNDMTLGEYNIHKQTLAVVGDFEPIQPSCARKLIGGGVDYAKQYGLKPHRDCMVAKQVFGDIDPAACPRVFEYGKDGKPFYVSGPHDSPMKVRTIMRTLALLSGLLAIAISSVAVISGEVLPWAIEHFGFMLISRLFDHA